MIARTIDEKIAFAFIDNLPTDKAKSLSATAVTALDKLPEADRWAVRFAHEIGWFKQAIQLYCKSLSSK